MSSIKKSLFEVMIVMLAVGLCGCGTLEKEATGQPTAGPGLANPASVYCEGLGYELELRSDETGSYGVCIFPDGSECEEWDFLAGRCGQEHSYCAQQGFLIEAEEESNIGKCVFTDGSFCMELDYFEGRCVPEGNQ
jgi:putative hemolysin